MFHVKDAEFNPTGRQGVYGGYQGWVNRAGRFRSLGDGQVDFGAVFSKMAANDFAGWAVVGGNAPSSTPRTGPARARISSSATSSASPKRPLTILPMAAPTRPPTGACWGFEALCSARFEGGEIAAFDSGQGGLDAVERPSHQAISSRRATMSGEKR